MTSAFKGFTFKMSDEASPEVYATLGEVLSASGVGVTNSTIDVTNTDSGNVKEYIAGMADGSEISVECNALHGNTKQTLAIAKVDAGGQINIQLVMSNTASSPVTTITITALVTMLSWSFTPGFDDKNGISFTMKISGTPTLVEA